MTANAVHRWQRVALTAAGVLSLAAWSHSPARPAAGHQPQPAPSADVRVVGTDYAFQMPQHIAAGVTTFSFENRGSVRHELAIARLKPGVSAAQALKGLAAGTLEAEDVIEGQAAILVAAPGRATAGAPSPRVWLQLVRGRSYLVGCTLTDGRRKQPHVMLGMMAAFTAE